MIPTKPRSPTCKQGFHNHRVGGFPANPAHILEEHRKDRADAVTALAAMCVLCRVSAAAIRSCDKNSCPAHFRRPYQIDVPPRGAPHLEVLQPNAEFGGSEE